MEFVHVARLRHARESHTQRIKVLPHDNMEHICSSSCVCESARVRCSASEHRVECTGRC